MKTKIYLDTSVISAFNSGLLRLLRLRSVTTARNDDVPFSSYALRHCEARSNPEKSYKSQKSNKSVVQTKNKKIIYN